ncbi:Sel1-repeat containing protein [Gracilaria domingensis]|nr:Sel1-repeat containing protein [Gracilaria domingensis]
MSDLGGYFFGLRRRGYSAWNQKEEEPVLEHLISLAEEEISLRQNGHAAVKLFRLAGLLGHSGAMSTAGALLLSGEASLPRDISRAVHHLRIASRAGQPDAHGLLGFLHASGIADRYGVEKSEALALLHWKIAAGTGNVYSMTALGFRHLYGINLKQSCKTASEYYKQAAHAIATDARHWPTPENFLNSKPPLPEGLEDVGRGDRAAMTALGALHYYGGYGIHPDQAQARLVLGRAADAGGHEAHAMLGYIDMRDRRNESAALHFRHAAADGNKMGHYAMGMCNLHGLLGFDKNYVRAAMHFELASKEGHADSSFQLALLLWNGRGRKEDRQAAYLEFEKAATHGNIQAKFNLGTILLSGTPPAKASSCVQGVKYLKEVAEEGEWKTLFDLASGSLEDGDEFGAFYRYMQAGYVGIEIAEFNAAILLEQSMSDGVAELSHWDRERRLEEAYQLYQYSGLQGHTDSLVRLGNVLYSESRAYDEAARVYEKAAELKNAEGMVAIGLMHARGLGVEKDRDIALHYLTSASLVNEDAVAPATVAIFGLRVYWALLDICERFGDWCSGDTDFQAVQSELHVDKLARKPDREGTLSQNRFSSTVLGSFAEDFTVFGALLLALCGILVIRGKRLARQLTMQPDRDS